MTYFNQPEAHIAFPVIEDPSQRIYLKTLGFRVNGLWLVHAEGVPPVRYAAPPAIGRIALDFGMQDPGFRHLEPGMVNRQAHMWVHVQAETAGLQVTGYRNLNHVTPNEGHCAAAADYLIARA